MNTASFLKRRAYFVIGGIGLIMSTGYLGMSLQLPLGRIERPGAGVFPIFVGVILILASLATIWEGWRMDRTLHVDMPTGVDRRRLLSLIGLSIGYFIALPWLGQLVCSILFCVLLMRVLSDLGWLRIVSYSLVMSVTIYVVFVLILKVPMPRGILAF